MLHHTLPSLRIPYPPPPPSPPSRPFSPGCDRGSLCKRPGPKPTYLFFPLCFRVDFPLTYAHLPVSRGVFPLARPTLPVFILFSGCRLSLMCLDSSRCRFRPLFIRLEHSRSCRSISLDPIHWSVSPRICTAFNWFISPPLYSTSTAVANCTSPFIGPHASVSAALVKLNAGITEVTMTLALNRDQLHARAWCICTPPQTTAIASDPTTRGCRD